MSNQNDSSPVPPIAQPHARHRFLWRFKASQDAAAVVRVLELLDQWQNETFQWGPGDDEASLIRGELAAAGADLLAVVDHLREIAEHRVSSGLAVEDWRLADKAAGWAEELERIGRSIVAATTEPDAEE
jgi:hypothetical protein